MTIPSTNYAKLMTCNSMDYQNFGDNEHVVGCCVSHLVGVIDGIYNTFNFVNTGSNIAFYSTYSRKMGYTGYGHKFVECIGTEIYGEN